MFPRQCIRLHLRHHCGNRATAGGQHGTWTLHHRVNSVFEKKTFQTRHFACRKFNHLAIDGGVNSTPSAHTFSHPFETHPNRESLMAGLNKNQKINLFSEESKELIRSMGNTEYFELSEITSKMQCPDCSLFWGKRHGILHVRQMPAAFGKKSTVEQR